MEKLVLSSYGGGNVSESQKAGTIRSLARWLNWPPHLTDEQMQMWTCAGSGCTTPGPPPTPLWDVGVYQPSRSLVCFQCRLGGGSGACFWKYSCHQGYKRCSQKCTSTQYECIGSMPNLGWTKWWKSTCWTTDWSINLPPESWLTLQWMISRSNPLHSNLPLSALKVKPPPFQK